MNPDTTPNPIEPDKITNADESKELPGNNSEIQAPRQTDELDTHYEGVREAGNVAAEDEKETDKLDGSNVNNLRTK
ncbi:hypothetical protein [Adhaeribacter rhizoryzae]|uniref:Uncharacterized protein n=1 Tax=Adhaeribacter rhizoryzae TaxID=2607907 RepID=A0A5M6DPG5_9BACT|nr:hypothetical protein [Adhaeribacter rhizoryzae]KAA5549353.1 hypothetical protein F0145_01815 [Adhaeribacter rhizoryzae]